MMEASSTVSQSFEAFAGRVRSHIEVGARFAGLMASANGPATELLAVLSQSGSLVAERTALPEGVWQYPSLTPDIPSAGWYEREIFDLFGVAASGRYPLEPLVLPLASGAGRPRPGSGEELPFVTLDPRAPMTRLNGEGVFTMSYGPVRSGVFEAIEYIVETPGEDIPSLNLRVSYKHRGVEKAFEGLSVDDGVLLAERYEGVASVAHALAYCGAVEQIADVTVPMQAGFVRVLHAELERIVNHLDTVIRHVEAAGQAVAFSRFSLHKERVQRLRARLCGSRFGRGVVVVGGVSGPPAIPPTHLLLDLDEIEAELARDTKLLMSTPSFLDRLRGTGVLSPMTVREYGALGPVARGSGMLEDVRFARPYAAYGRLGHGLLDVLGEGDALARQKVRIQEIDGAFGLIRRAVEELNEFGGPADGKWFVPFSSVSGDALGWSEAPQGELLTWVQVRDGILTRVKPRSASFHNLAMFPFAFPKDILTDFAFIEASFGLSIAGVAG
ncbi:MAG TPA: NADH-quinone oxidoreductase subunit C [Acidimicrobiales bacterium]|jgi:Ni,Fe-hydrogenase III large subunit